MNFGTRLLRFFTKPRVEYQPLIEVRISKDAILHNLQEFKSKYPELQFAPVLKSNAYGHGLILTAKILDKENCPFFVVDSFYEALTLRQSGIKTKILLIGFTRMEQLLGLSLKNCVATILDFDTLIDVAKRLKRPTVFHLKIDTGMHRQGILPEKIDEAIKLVKNNPNFILEGLCSHLADADGESDEFTNKQIDVWNQVVEKFKQNFFGIKYFHLAATAGIFYADKITANVGRLGLGLYGINPSMKIDISLRPALEIKSVISSVKEINKGEKVGYGITFESVQPMKIATVPVGYNEGVDRRLSNKGGYKCKGVFCPLVGRVSMNISSIDVSLVPDVKVGDEVVIISGNQSDSNSVENIAKSCGCIPYEILVHIPSLLRRVVS